MTNYPSTVKKWVDETEYHLGDEFFSPYLFSNLEIARNTYREIAGNAALQSWLSNGDVILTDDVMETILNDTIVYSAIYSLQKKNLIDSIEDEKGEKVFWLTKEGRALITTAKTKESEI
jgi:hypothetical protein